MTVLTASHKEQLAAEGYVVVDGVFDPPVDLAPLLAEYNAALDEIATELVASKVLECAVAGEIDRQSLRERALAAFKAGPVAPRLIPYHSRGSMPAPSREMMHLRSTEAA